MVKTVLLISLLLIFAACGAPENEDQFVDPPPDPEPIDNSRPLPPASEIQCPTGTRLTYDNFGEAFFLTYCTMCHSASLAQDQRNDAPIDVDFDTVAGVLAWRGMIITSTTGEKPTMPPAMHVPKAEKALLAEWLNCGAPGKSDRMQTPISQTTEE